MNGLYSLDDHPEHRARLHEHAQMWIDNAMSAEPADQPRAAEAIRGLYRAAGLTPPERELFVRSPFTAHIAGGVAAGALWVREHPEQHGVLFGRSLGEDELMAGLREACARAVRRGMAALTGDPVAPPAAVATSVATGPATSAATREFGHAATDVATDDATDDATSSATDVATDAATYAATHAATSSATRAATYAATHAATSSATDAATRVATSSATDVATHAATSDATRVATDAATSSATRAATYAATDDATYGATHVATSGATSSATRAATYAATDVATSSATDAATRVATYAATDVATHAATSAATRVATDAATDAALVAFFLRCVGLAWRMHNGGSDWSSWPAYLSFFDRVAGLDLPQYAAWRHYEQAALASASRIMHERFWIASDRHTSVHVDDQRRLHREDGPARTWADGWAIWAWHGTHVPRSLIEDGWTFEQIIREPNSEIRRCAIERVGWHTLTDRLSLVDECPDPGNAPHSLRLYDLPDDLAGLYDEPVRILIMTNGSPDRSGELRTYGETVPAQIESALQAAAWQYGWPVEAYAALERRT